MSSSVSSDQSRWRLLNPDGSFNVIRTRNKQKFKDLYHHLLTLSWTRYFILVLVTFTVLNLVFATAYFLTGEYGLNGVDHTSDSARFLDCFFFSVQTAATIGYGRISPQSLVANVLVSFEAITGMLGLALMTGLFFARFSRPTSRVSFSNKAIISNIDGVPCFCFRLANHRANQMVEARIVVVLAKTEFTKEGERFRNFYDLKLERSFSPMLVMSWLVVHPLDPDSPLYGATKEDLTRDNAEIIVSLTGIDETFSQTIHSRHSYVAEDILWNARYKDIVSQTGNGKILLSIEKIHDVELT